MLRMTFEGRAPRVFRRDELIATLSALEADDSGDRPSGRVDVEWLSPAGVVLAHRAFDSLVELRDVLTDPPHLKAEQSSSWSAVSTTLIATGASPQC